MKSIFSIFDARGFFSLVLTVACFVATGVIGIIGITGVGMAQENYSLWPRRPEALAKAQILAEQGDLVAAEKILAPLLILDNVVGAEARDTLGRIKIRQMLNPQTCDAQTYTVVRGDTWIGVSRKTKCPLDYLMYLNQLMDLKGLQIGQKLKVKNLDYRIEVNVPQKRITLWDGEKFIKSYPIHMFRDLGKEDVTTTIKSESAMHADREVTGSTQEFASGDKTIFLLKPALVITSSKTGKMNQAGYYLKREDCNELSLLVRAGNRVDLIKTAPAKKS
ncbi:MAG: LysM peptidoglycan-binding domain-containing protein [Akkermansia sp.]